MNEKAQNVLDFATHVLASQTGDHDEREACRNTKLYIQNLPLARAQIPVQIRADFKRTATELYNKHITPAKDDDQASPNNAYGALIRALALLMLSSLVKLKPGPDVVVSSLTNAMFSTTKESLRADETDVATKLVEHFALSDSAPDSDQDQQHAREFQKSLITYNCLRLSLAWKTGRLDLAEHWYKHIETLLLRTPDGSVAEILVDLLFEIGLQELRCTNIATAVAWLHRAYTCVQDDNLKAQIPATDLHLNVLHAYCRALHQSSDIAHRQLSGQVLTELVHEHGSKLSVQLLQLECLRAEFPRSLAKFVEILNMIASSAPLVDNTHHLILHYIQILFESDALTALSVIEQYISERLVLETVTNWTEEAIVRYLWLCAGCGGTADLMDASEVYLKLDGFSKDPELALSHAAAQAAYTIVCKAISLGSESQAAVVAWCKIGLHKLFEQSDETSIGKLERRLIMCHLSTSDLEAAQSILDGMTFIRKNNRLSLFLAYTVAIRAGQETQAQVALNTMANAPEDNSSVLMACAAEVKRHGSPLEVARLLQRLFDRHIQRPITGIDRASLLKSVTQVLIHVTGEKAFCNEEEVLNRLCGAFKAAMSHLETSSSAWWFANVACELGVTKSRDWPSRFVLDILHYGERLWSMLKPKSSPNSSTNEQLYCKTLEVQVLLYAWEAQRAASGAFTINDLPKTSYESKARPNTDDIPRLLNEQVCKKFMMLQQECSEREDTTIDPEARSRLHDLFPVAFEALLNLNTLVSVESQDLAFDEASLQALLRSAQQLQVPAGTYALLADQILSATSTQIDQGGQYVRMPLLVGARLLGQVITALRNLEVYDIDQAARWIRCIVQLIISRLEQQLDEGVDSVKLEQGGMSMLKAVIGQAIDLAEGAVGSNEVHEIEDVIMTDGDSTLVAQPSYPAEELEWLVTKVFNLSVDLVVAQGNGLATFWCHKALEIAGILVQMQSDRGIDLRELLTQRMLELDLDGGGVLANTRCSAGEVVQ